MKTENFESGNISKEDEMVFRTLRAKICKEMAETEPLNGFKDIYMAIKALSCCTVDICREYAGDKLSMEDPERFDIILKVALIDIIDRIKNLENN